MTAKRQDGPRFRDEDPNDNQDAETDAGEEDPVPDAYEYLRDAPWQGPYGDPNGSLEPDQDEGLNDDPWAEAWPDQDWPEDPWPDDPWSDDPFSRDLDSEDGSNSDEGDQK